MHQLKRYCAALLFLGLLLLPLLFIAGLQLKQLQVQHEAKERLEKQSLHTLVLDRLTWVKKNKEIRVDGHLFDIKSVHFDGKKYTVTGLYDHEEMAIEKKLHQQEEHASGQKALIHFLLLTQALFLVTALLHSCKFFPVPRIYRMPAAAVYTDPFLPLFTPPPSVR